VFEMNGWMD